MQQNKQPRWQGAVILHSKYYPHMAGKKIWVRSEPPLITDYMELSTGILYKNKSVFTCNLTDERGRIIVIEPHYLELQADFSDNPPLIPYEEWSVPKTEEGHAQM